MFKTPEELNEERIIESPQINDGLLGDYEDNRTNNNTTKASATESPQPMFENGEDAFEYRPQT